VTGGRVYVTTVTTEGKSKPPQIGTEYSNEYVAELQKQGLPMPEVIKRVTERDIELPNEVMLHYFIYCLNLKSGKVEWQKQYIAAFDKQTGKQAWKTNRDLGDLGGRGQPV